MTILSFTGLNVVQGSTILSFTGLNVIAPRSTIISVSGIVAGGTITIETDGNVDLTGVTINSLTYAGIALADVTVIDLDTLTATLPLSGFNILAANDLVLTADALVSPAYSLQLTPKLGQAIALTVDYADLHPDSLLSGITAYSTLVAGDILETELTTSDINTGNYAVVLSGDGQITLTGADADPDDQLVIFALHDVSDTYNRSNESTWTIGTPVNRPAQLVVIDSIVENRTSAVVNFSYPGADVTSYEYNIGGSWITCTSPLTIPSLTESTLYNFEIRPVNGNTRGSTASDTFTTLDATDTTPSPATIPPLTGQLLSDDVTFAPFTVRDVDAGVDVPVTNPSDTYSVSTDSGATWGAPTASNTNVRLNYQIRLHHTTAATYNTPKNASIYVGGVEFAAISTTKVDDVIPVITLVGGASIDINEGGTYSDVLGTTVTASDNVDGDISNNITITGSVDGNTVGTYTLTYDVADAAGNSAATVTRTVRVVDITLPVITLVGSSTVTHRQGTTYTDAGATATDATDGNLTSSIVTTGTLFDSNTVGAYTIRYNVTDSEGNAATEVTRTINVTDQTSPVITLINGSTLNLTQGEAFNDPGATATDNNDGSLTADIIVGGQTVDINAVGSYVITYNVSDAAGNAATQISRTVNVLAEVVIAIVNDFIPRLLSTDIQEATVFKGRGNRISVTISHNDSVVDLSIFDRFELYGLTESAIDSATSPAIDTDDGNGIIIIDAGEITTMTGSAKTTLIAYSDTEYPEGVVLWHPSLAQAHLTINILNA